MVEWEAPICYSTSHSKAPNATLRAFSEAHIAAFPAVMPTVSPVVAPPHPVASSTSSPRRLIPPLGRLRDLELERAHAAARRRARKRQRQSLMLRLGLAACLALPSLWLGAKAWSQSAGWPRGAGFSLAAPVGRAPVYAGAGKWLFAGADGGVWRAGQSAAPVRLWACAFPAAPHVVPVGADVVVAGGDGALVRFDAGEHVQWSAHTGRTMAARPVVCADGAQSLLVGADDDGHLWARDAGTGKEVWDRQAGAPVGEGLCATPWGVVAPLLGGTSGRGGLRCFGVGNGAARWSFPFNGRERAAGTATPRLDAATNRLFWCNDEGAVFALDARTGRKIWKSWARPVGSSAACVVLRSSPVLVDGKVVVGGSDGVLRAYDARDGRAVWVRNMGQPLASPLGKARWQGRAVVVVGDNPVVLVDAQSGEEVRAFGAGVAAWNGREWAAIGASGGGYLWRAD